MTDAPYDQYLISLSVVIMASSYGNALQEIERRLQTDDLGTHHPTPESDHHAVSVRPRSEIRVTPS